MGLEVIDCHDDDDDAGICRTQNWDVWWVFVVAVMDLTLMSTKGEGFVDYLGDHN